MLVIMFNLFTLRRILHDVNCFAIKNDKSPRIILSRLIGTRLRELYAIHRHLFFYVYQNYCTRC